MQGMGAHIVFARFPSLDSYRLHPWTEHTASVTGSRVPAGRGGEALVWQLASANNRQLARSAEVHTSVPDVVSDAFTVVAQSEAEIILVRKDGAGAFGWYLATPFRVLAICPRWYPTERERRHSIELVLDALPGAELTRAVRVVGSDRTEELGELVQPTR